MRSQMVPLRGYGDRREGGEEGIYILVRGEIGKIFAPMPISAPTFIYAPELNRSGAPFYS